MMKRRGEKAPIRRPPRLDIPEARLLASDEIRQLRCNYWWQDSPLVILGPP